MQSSMVSADVIVIGGGPAGMMAAWQASRHSRVILLERGLALGRKLLLTGGGRCNISNTSPLEVYLEKIPRGAPFLRSAFSSFFHEDFALLLGKELPLIKEGERLYPKSQSALDVLHFFQGKLSRCDVRVHAKVNDLKKSGENWLVSSSAGDFLAPKVIIATGGASLPSTGSDGSLHAILKKIGVQVNPLSPTLVSFLLHRPNKELAGLSLPEVKLHAGGASYTGSLLFTHKGLSGPAVLDLSSLMERQFPLPLTLDFAPRVSEKDVEEILFSGKKSLAARARQFVPERLARHLFPDVTEKHHMRKEEISSAVAQLKGYTFIIQALAGFESAIVTRGGVDLRQIHPRTLEHKKLSGLYFAGECLDIDALSGGFNLQIAWSTGFVSGRA